MKNYKVYTLSNGKKLMSNICSILKDCEQCPLNGKKIIFKGEVIDWCNIPMSKEGERND